MDFILDYHPTQETFNHEIMDNLQLDPGTLVKILPTGLKTRDLENLVRMYTDLKTMDPENMDRLHTALKTMDPETLVQLHTSLKTMDPENLFKLYSNQKSPIYIKVRGNVNFLTMSHFLRSNV